jgi:isoleucyl-tRNA synthetase
VAALLDRHRTELPMLLNVSDVSLTVQSMTAESGIDVEVDKAPGVKCARCWRYVSSVRTEPEWAGICDRCVEALAEPVNS